ncbi:MAG: deoxyguanosinetriphosphate triphosphohydrolase [Acidobacteriota bacterium]|nr:MAG: deoxyguanosinetriphosphate triphosphohydrolase [Acidobacteriota bacterium]
MRIDRGPDGLAPWAQRAARSRGRRHAEPEHAYRPPYARDRDRIIHCRAFRRLEYKTQVFVFHEGDHYRNRLTHSIEVAQIGRTVARALGLEPDLVESLALSHDLGHTPFGHLGEEVLSPLLADEGGFDHNRQTLRIVEQLEERYPEFTGLNLTWEVREGIVKHSGPPDASRWPEAVEYLPDVPPPIEAQIIDIVDEIAYNHHDLEDGFESRLLDADELADAVPLFGEPYRAAAREHPSHDPWMWIKIALRRVIDRLVSDLVATTGTRLRELGIRDVDEVRARPEWLAGLSAPVAEANRRLKSYLGDRLYAHPRIAEVKQFLGTVLVELFEVYVARPDEMPPRFRRRIAEAGPRRVACDYLAGMTDRYALLEHERLCGGPGPSGIPFATR